MRSGWFAFLNSILVLFGMLVMWRAIRRGKRLALELETSEFRDPWLHLLRLMRFFLAGYAVALLLVVAGKFEILSAITAVIFAVGALFVSSSVSVSVGVSDALLKEIAALKRSELERTKDEEQFHTFFDIANVGFSQVDPVTLKFLGVNAKMEEITGYSGAELQNLTFSDITHPEDRERDLAAYRRMAQGASPTYTGEKRYIRKDGSVVWVAVNGVLARSRFDGRARSVSVIQDITESRLRRQLLETLVQHAPIGITLMSAPDMVLEWVNPAAASMSPFKLETGKSVFEHMPPDLVADIRPRYDQLFQTGKTSVERDRLLPFRLPNGTFEDRYYTLIRVRVSLPDGRAGAVGLFQETTDQVQLRHELENRVAIRTEEVRKAYTFVNAVLENIPDALFIKEAGQLRVTRVNKSWENLFGFSTAEIVGKNDYDLLPKEEADFLTENDRKVLISGTLLDIPEESVHTRHQGTRILHTKKVPIFDEMGRPEYLLGIAEDITVKKELMRERLARAESERALHLRDEFISIAGHELKTPLTALRIQVQLMSRFFPNPESPETVKFLKLVRDSQDHIDRFAKLVDNLLDVSRASSGRLFIEKSEDDLSETVRRVVKRHSAELERSKCTLGLDLMTGVVGFWDPPRIEQLLVNLLSNAMKYGAGRPIEISTTVSGDVAQLTVRDHGIGIASEDQDRVFDRFERAVSMKTFGGLGLGLFISRQIVAAHGGTIRVESSLGRGSCFTVELPLRNQVIETERKAS